VLATTDQRLEALWNGFDAGRHLRRFDPGDERTQILLAGPQINLATGAPALDRQGNPLVFDPNIPDVTAATEGQGVRIDKWPLDPNHVARNNGNDYAWFRLGEMYLIRAEAENELGSTAAAITDINLIRSRVFSPAKPLAAGLTQQQVRDALLKERLYELTAEGKRRQDLDSPQRSPRGHGTPRPPTTRSGPSRIPQTQIETNPFAGAESGLLVQAVTHFFFIISFPLRRAGHDVLKAVNS
jgi:hypothetical protein